MLIFDIKTMDTIMNDATSQLHALFSETRPASRSSLQTHVNGVEAANRAVANCAPDSSMIFLTRSEYEDLLSRAQVSDLRTYKKKTIVIVSDNYED